MILRALEVQYKLKRPSSSQDLLSGVLLCWSDPSGIAQRCYRADILKNTPAHEQIAIISVSQV